MVTAFQFAFSLPEELDMDTFYSIRESYELGIHQKASSLDQIKMTKNWLEFDQNFFTKTNLNFIPQKICWCGQLGQVPQPRLALAGTPAQPR